MVSPRAVDTVKVTCRHPVSDPFLRDRQATLQVAGGDRSRALKMLEDPDALMANPEVKRIIAEGAGGTALEVVEGQYPEKEAAAAAAGSTAAAAGAAAEKATGARRKEKEKEEAAEAEKEATDEDPREHLNLVFIGHGG